jgi:hypothetical protein
LDLLIFTRFKAAKESSFLHICCEDNLKTGRRTPLRLLFSSYKVTLNTYSYNSNIAVSGATAKRPVTAQAVAAAEVEVVVAAGVEEVSFDL